MQELISVVIPTYNRAFFIGRAVRSVLQQTYPHVELIVVDDGSTDDTGLLLDPFKELPRFRYLRQSNKGRSVARNEGLRLANGEWILFLDSDDYLLPHALETLSRLADESKESDLVYANFKFVNKDNKPIGHVGEFEGQALDCNLLLEIFQDRYWLTKTGTYLVRKELVKGMGGFITGFEPSEDLDFNIQLLIRSKASFTNEVVLYVERHEGNTSSLEILEALVKICQHYYKGDQEWQRHLPLEKGPEARFSLNYKLANGLYETDRHRQAFLHYVKLIRRRPRILFDKFIFKQFFASMIPPTIKRKLRKRKPGQSITNTP